MGLADLILYTFKTITLPMPLIKNFSLSNGTLEVSGFNGVPLGEYYVLASTNLLCPINQWAVASTNNFAGAGGFSFNAAASSSASALFYALKLP
jgi:hypothetical protein